MKRYNQLTENEKTPEAAYQEALILIEDAHVKERRTLYLDDLNLHEFPVEIQSLTSLNSLCLLNTSITDISFLTNMTGLSEIAVFGQIKDLTPLSDLTTLKALGLDGNPITNLTPLINLKDLKQLLLRYTQIKDIIPLAGLVNLTYLDLSYTQIESLRPIRSLLEKYPDLHFKYKSELGIHLVGCPLNDPPLEIAQQGAKAILRYWDLQDRAGKIINNEARILLVGEGGAGKTSLHKKLYNPEVLISCEEGKGKEDATVGINVGTKPYEIAGTEDGAKLLAYLWDFGGQEEQYLTHQYFFEPESLYVLVVDARTQSVDFGYWFRIINLLGRQREEEKIPVLIVMNEIDIDSADIPALRQYKEQFPYLDLHIRAVNLGRAPEATENDPRFAVVQQLIAETFGGLPIIGREIAAPYPVIRKELRELRAAGTNYLPYDDFSAICVEKGLQAGPEVGDFARYLHALGEVIHYYHLQDTDGNPKLLAKYVLLNPTWATEAIYLILGEKELRQKETDKGVFSKALLEKHWQGYTDTEKRLLESLLLEDAFEVCFPLTDRPGYYLAPSLLPRDGELLFEPAEAHGLRFRYEYPQILPKGLVSRLIVRLNKLIKDKHYYRTGVLLEYREVNARVEMLTTAEGNDNVIDIWLDRGGEDAIHLLRRIRDEVEDIHKKSFKNIQVEELVPCPCATCRKLDQPYFFEYSYLREKKRQSPEGTVECRKKPFHQVAIVTILEGVLPRAEMRQLEREVRMSESVFLEMANRPTTHIEKVEGGITQVAGDQHQDNRKTETIEPFWKYVFSPNHFRGLLIALALAIFTFIVTYFVLPAEWVGYSWLVALAVLAAGTAWALTRSNKYYAFARLAFFSGVGITGILNTIPKYEGVLRARWQGESGKVSTIGNLVLDAPPWLQVATMVLSLGLTGWCLWLSYREDAARKEKA